MYTQKELIENMAIALCDAKWTESELIISLTKFVDSINSARRSERRAIGSNSKAKEVETVRWRCLLCGRDKFTRKSPHNCNTGFRKRHIRWEKVSTD